MLLAWSAAVALLSSATLAAEPGTVTAAPFPQPRESVDCRLDAKADGSSLVLLTSTGVPNSELRNALRELVLRLPNAAWAEGGAARKERAARRGLAELARANFSEPDLYAGLRVLLLEDPCMLKEQFWNSAAPDFNISAGINYVSAKMQTDVSLLRPFFGKGLDGAWCVDHSKEEWGAIGPMGFQAASFSHFSILDRFAPDSLKKALFELQTSHLPMDLAKRAELKAALLRHRADTNNGVAAREFDSLLEDADIILVNGGNPDLGRYALEVFGAAWAEKIVARVKAGSLIYVGRSAGSMVGSADEGLTFEPNPVLIDVLLENSTVGLGLAGACAIRPHYTQAWDQTSRVYEKASGLTMVRLPNNEGLQCKGLGCAIVGTTSRMGPSAFTGRDDPNLIRLFAALARQVGGYLRATSTPPNVHAVTPVQRQPVTLMM